jgi:hypothetical protein
MPTSPLLDTVMAPAEFPNLSVIALQPSTVASLADLPIKRNKGFAYQKYLDKY